jgi:hypothetical protein
MLYQAKHQTKSMRSGYWSCKNSEIVMIFVSPNLIRSSRSLSPVNKKSACPSTDNESRKLSLTSRQTSILVSTSTKSANWSIVSSISSMSPDEKKRLNFGRFATAKNSSSNSWLKTKIPFLEKRISSSLVKSLVIKKLIQRFVWASLKTPQTRLSDFLTTSPDLSG